MKDTSKTFKYSYTVNKEITYIEPKDKNTIKICLILSCMIILIMILPQLCTPMFDIMAPLYYNNDIYSHFLKVWQKFVNTKYYLYYLIVFGILLLANIGNCIDMWFNGSNYKEAKKLMEKYSNK